MFHSSREVYETRDCPKVDVQCKKGSLISCCLQPCALDKRWPQATPAARQLERWQLLPDSALCERVIAYLDVDITPWSLKDQNSNNLYHVAQLIPAIARKSTRVETTLGLDRSELNPTLALKGISFPRVCRVIAPNCSEGFNFCPSDSWSLLLGV